MSYWVYLNCPHCGRNLIVKTKGVGGTYCVNDGADGYYDAELNVTYNYGRIWSVSEINKMTGADSIPILEKVVADNGVEQDNDYWNPTPGNVGYMAQTLLNWAKEHPEGIWEVS